MATMNQVGVGLSGASGTGSFAGTTSPTFVTPNIGAASATSLAVGNLTLATNTITSSTGDVSFSPNSGFASMSQSVNGSVQYRATNSSSGTSALAGIAFFNNVTSAGINYYSSGYTGVAAWANYLTISTSNAANGIRLVATANKDIKLSTTGLDTSDLYIDGLGNVLAGVGNLSVTTGYLQANNLRLITNTISSTNTNGDINLSPNGSGKTKVNGANATVEFAVISSNATGFPDIGFYRNTSTAIGFINAGVNDAYNNTGDGIFFANPVSGGKIFLRDSTGNALTISAGNTTLSGSLTTSQTAGIIGTTTNNNAQAGSVGELLSNSSAAGSVSLTTLTPVNITSISLTAGDWDVWGNIEISGAATTVITATRCSLGTVTANFAGYPYDSWNYWPGAATPFASYAVTVAPPAQRFSLSSTTTIYLTMTQVFSVDTMSAGGAIFARRRR